MAIEKQDFKQYTALGIIILLIVFLANALIPFITVLFGALIIITLFHPLYKHFVAKGVKPGTSAVLICIISTLIIAIPLGIVSGIIITEAGQAIQQSSQIAEQITAFDNRIPEINITSQVQEAVSSISRGIQNGVIDVVDQFTTLIINLIVMYFLIYYMLVHNKEAKKGLNKYMPFNKKHTTTLVEAFTRITHTTILGAGLVALIQGIILGIGLRLIGVPNPVLLGFVGAVISFLPVIGIALIWIPVGIYQLLEGSVWGTVGILLTGAAISVIDYTVRPRFQQKKGEIHPIISILGVIIGIQYFGIFGIVVGPLLLSYATLTINMFIEEYVART